jgi:hypothetical protein
LIVSHEEEEEKEKEDLDMYVTHCDSKSNTSEILVDKPS